MIVGIDTGGTFTDVVIVRDGAVDRFKVPSTPRDPSAAYANSLKKVFELYPDDAPSLIIYGSTLATNALLESKLAKTCFITNKGFEDIFRLGRQNRSADDLYSSVPRNRPEPVTRDMVLGLDTRQGPNGEVEKPLATGDIAELVVALDEINAEAIGIGFLHAHADPSMEVYIADTLCRAGFKVCASSDIDPNPYEYERFTTTAINAGLMPMISAYLGKLEDISDLSPLLMQSNGGVAPIHDVEGFPIKLLLSGPAGGVMGLSLLADWIGEKKLIGFDMGGTSTDVAVYDGGLPFRQQLHLAGLPIRCPSLDIQTVGAGGGSIVKIGPGGALLVGPQSAGAHPGPACYGKNGPLTLTDCNLWTGRLPRGIMLAGSMELDYRATENAFTEEGKGILNPDALADGALKVAAATMAGAVRKAARGCGVDPSEFTLVSFGGAGGLHAVDLAKEVGIDKILIPKDAGVFSALGMALSRPRRDILHHSGMRWERDSDGKAIIEKVKAFAPVIDEGDELLISARCRYPGQRFTIELDFGPDLPERFDEEHKCRYGLSRPEATIEIVTIVFSILGPKPDVPIPIHEPCKPGYPVPVEAIAWSEVKPGDQIPGPVSVVGREASAWIPDGIIAEVDSMGNLLVDVRR